MSRYIAFLRAINVGGHTVKMEALRQHFESFGFSDVETFIASGNVIFQTAEQDVNILESKIASGLKTALGYDIATFVRTEEAFSPVELDEATAYNIAFLASPIDDLAKQKLMALTTHIDRFAVHSREVYWLCRKKQSESTFSNALLERTLGIKSTLRGVNTVKKLAARLLD
jgi:uncharacterized protein (DUF1697 family)